MAQKTLTAAFVKSITCTSGLKKTDFFDTDAGGSRWSFISQEARPTLYGIKTNVGKPASFA